MTRTERWWLSVAAAVMVYGCGDDGGTPKPCPEGVTAGQTTDCSCEGGGMGKATCQDDKTLTACVCEGGDAGSGGAGSGGSGGSGGGGSGGSGGSGGGGSGGSGGGGSGGSGGDAGTTEPAPDDGGMPMTDGGSEPSPIKTDGSLLALCEDGTQCGLNLDCYGAATGGGFCTTLCTQDADCEEVGADFACSSGGRCRQTCTAVDDTGCPDGMQCLMTGGVGGGGGGATFACAYGPNAGQPSADAFGECMGDQACGGGGSTCSGDTMMGATGFCTVSCMDDTDCADLSAGSGNLESSCEFSAGGFMQTAVCALNCDAADAECPDGMTCIASMGPLPSLCAY